MKNVKRIGYGLISFMLLMAPASSEVIGISIANFDDNFLTVLRNGMSDYARKKGNITLQIEDAQGDVSRQQSQIQNFIAAKVDAIIVNPVDTDATVAMSKLAEDRKVPLVYVNRQPINVDSLPTNQAFVASDEVESGTLQTKEVCRLLKGKGKVVVIMGELSNQAARQRTQDVRDVIATPECSGMEIVESQTANWQRTQALDLVTNWITAGLAFDAVIANADEMAVGAIQALKATGRPLDSVVVAGIDGSRDALALMKAGDLEVTVFQDAFGQGSGAIEVALKIIHGEPFDQKTYIPFELVTPANMAEFENRN